MECSDGEITNQILVWKFLFGQEYRKGFRQDLGKGLARVWTGPGQDANRIQAWVWARFWVGLRQGFRQSLGKVLGSVSAMAQPKVWVRV